MPDTTQAVLLGVFTLTAAGAAVGTGRGVAAAGILALVVAAVSALTLPKTKATAGAPIHMH